MYFFLKSNTFLNDLKNRAISILKNKALQKKYNYILDSVDVAVFENIPLDELIENPDLEMEYCLRIKFVDDTNDKRKGEQYYGVDFYFFEEFQQINFSDNQIYSVFSVHQGYGIEKKKLRDYRAFYKEFYSILCGIKSSDIKNASEFQEGRAMRMRKKKNNIISNTRRNGLLNAKGLLADSEVDKLVDNIYVERKKK